MVEEFKPSPKLKLIYWLYSLPYFISMAIVCIVVSVFNVLVGLILAIACIIVPLIIIAIWIPRFYESVIFRIEDDHVYARFGVW